MIISLEEEEQEELQDVAQNVVTLDGEVMAVNGRILAGHQQWQSPTGATASAAGLTPFDPALYAQGGIKGFRRPPSVTSVCSCTCYGTSDSKAGFFGGRGRQSRSGVGGGQAGGRRTSRGQQRVRRKRGFAIVRFFRRLLGLASGSSDHSADSADANFYDEETQSISNYQRYAIKRVSM